MPLASGTRLGPYEIGPPLGAGGMGEVYRARDNRLDRTVAVKILPAHLSEKPEAKERFDREARAISSLSHPNICHLYDVGQEGQVSYLVMEFLAGDTLADRLHKGPLPLEQALKYGVEICEGLEKAHRSGVVHRDLKPGNVMLTRSGAKLMDFGLAKPVAPANPASSGLTQTLASPSHPLTTEGTVVGTFQYMSPEQVEGREADAPVKMGSNFEAGAPVTLFQAHLHQSISALDVVSYDVTSDGQKFLINTKVGEPNAAPLSVILNWTSEMDK